MLVSYHHVKKDENQQCVFDCHSEVMENEYEYLDSSVQLLKIYGNGSALVGRC